MQLCFCSTSHAIFLCSWDVDSLVGQLTSASVDELAHMRVLRDHMGVVLECYKCKSVAGVLIVHRVVLCVRVLSECFMFSQFVTPPPAPRSRGPASASTCTDHVILCVQLFGDLRTILR